MNTSDECLAEFAADVMSHPVGGEVYVCADWIEGDGPNYDQAGAKTTLGPELVLHHTRENFSEESEEDIFAAAYRNGDSWMIRVREMDARPDRPTELIARIVEAFSQKYQGDLRYTFTPHHFNGYDLYVAHVEPQRI
jgi:hypothetical protein